MNIQTYLLGKSNYFHNLHLKFKGDQWFPARLLNVIKLFATLLCIQKKKKHKMYLCRLFTIRLSFSSFPVFMSRVYRNLYHSLWDSRIWVPAVLLSLSQQLIFLNWRTHRHILHNVHTQLEHGECKNYY